jgi:hypothetical protein
MPVIPSKKAQHSLISFHDGFVYLDKTHEAVTNTVEKIVRRKENQYVSRRETSGRLSDRHHDGTEETHDAGGQTLSRELPALGAQLSCVLTAWEHLDQRHRPLSSRRGPC